MNCKFVVGQKVVCKHPPLWTPDPGPGNGDVCMIIEMWPDPHNQEKIGLMFSEHGQVCFWDIYFEPVVDKKTDISVFQEMLTKAPETISA